MSLSAGEPIAAGAALTGIGAASSMALFSAFGGSLIGAGILIAVVRSQLPDNSSRIWRFLTSACSAPLFTLCGAELLERFFEIRMGAYTISTAAMIFSFFAWKIFTVLHNRGTSIVNKAIDKAIGAVNDDYASLDRRYNDSGRASRWMPDGGANKARINQGNNENQGGTDGGKDGA
jgi:hypothetical protein